MTQKMESTTHPESGLIVRVSKASRVSGVAGAIAGVIRDGHFAVVQAIGVEAIERAMIASALATRYLLDEGVAVVSIPEMFCTEGPRVIQGIRLVVALIGTLDENGGDILGSASNKIIKYCWYRSRMPVCEPAEKPVSP